jgi:hypothetical protein
MWYSVNVVLARGLGIHDNTPPFPAADISINMNAINAALVTLKSGVSINYTKLTKEFSVYRSIVLRRYRGKITFHTDDRENASLLLNE